MADEAFSAKLEGIDDLKRVMANLPDKIRKRAVRGALKDATKPMLQAAKQATPILKKPTPYRNAGTVQRALMIRNSKFARRGGDEGVFINPKPLVRQAAQGKKQKSPGKKGFAGSKNPNDPFYWRFLEFGTKKMPKREFLKPAADNKSSEVVQGFFAAVIPRIEKLNRTK